MMDCQWVQQYWSCEVCFFDLLLGDVDGEVDGFDFLDCVQFGVFGCDVFGCELCCVQFDFVVEQV